MAAAGREVWGEFRPPLRCRVKGEGRNERSPRPTAYAARAGLGLPACQPKTPHPCGGAGSPVFSRHGWGKAGDGVGSRARKGLTGGKGAQLSPTAGHRRLCP
jgi:hypothetical protein